MRCDVGTHVPLETLGFRILGRLGERDVSYAGEMMSAIALGLNVGTDTTAKWVGDNESVQQVVSAYLTQAETTLCGCPRERGSLHLPSASGFST